MAHIGIVHESVNDTVMRDPNLVELLEYFIHCVARRDDSCAIPTPSDVLANVFPQFLSGKLTPIFVMIGINPGNRGSVHWPPTCVNYLRFSLVDPARPLPLPFV